MYHNGSVVRSTVYFDDYESITENGVTRNWHDLGNGALYLTDSNGNEMELAAFTDRQGSILKLVDLEGNIEFDAAYDVWGHQTINTNLLRYYHGYTGHEMIPELALINMNGRFYDPLLARFLSPDNYVQAPDNSQNFNRYSYCLNNPLKYADPSGELAWFVPVIAGAIIGAYTGASIQSGTFAFWNWKSDAWKGAIVGGIVGATVGYGISSALASSGGVTGLTTSFGEASVVTKSAGITSSILNSGSVNIALNAISNSNWDGAWKSGLVGLATGAWAITGGFGMVKGFGATSRFGKLAGKLGYQMIGTVSQSAGYNWARNRGVFSNITLGVGPINLTIGKGQHLLQLRNNIGNAIFNTLGIANLFFGGKMAFDWENLSPVYYGGMRDKVFGKKSAFGVNAIFGSANILENDDDFSHEVHHLWQSRAMIDSFLPNYLMHGASSATMGGDFIEIYNFYEQLGYFHHWFK